MSSIFFGERTVVAGATAVTIDSLIRAAPGANQAPAFTGSGIGCAFELYCTGKDIYVGTASTVTDSGGGGLLSAGTPFPDYATGDHGNAVDVTQFYVYSASSDATITVYYRSK